MNEISILSFNIWFDEYAEIERTNALLACIYKNDPDVICLQEVKPHIYEKLINNLRKYNYHYPKKIPFSYGCVILSKYKISKCLTIPFKKTSMGRELIIAKIDVPISRLKNNDLIEEVIDIIVCTTHFESEFKRNEKNINKWAQINESFIILNEMHKRYSNVVFCLDTNLTEEEEKRNNFIFNEDEGWIDAWTKKGNDRNKYTFDCKNNLYLKTRKSRYRSRLDRILFKTNDLEIDHFDLIKDASDFVISCF
jgi:exonuclease III